jgi:hypothetical protein
MAARCSEIMFSGHSSGLLVIPLFDFTLMRIGLSVVSPQFLFTYDTSLKPKQPYIPLVELSISHQLKSEPKQDTMNDNEEFKHERDHQSLSSDSASLSSGTGTETNNTGEVSNDSSISIARAETKAVNRSKIVVLVVIAIAATACGAATYFFTKSEEEDDFHSQVRRD